ncbi:DUF2867 domain-containing protein [Undibacterium sp. TJN19]|uniref:DUF2867 domain-containing protein n=1 Tax=Undibacterium sp. TJN19 TaxID=3413055 RepID=UPI003BF064AA
MKPVVKEITVPSGSEISNKVAGAYFYDSYQLAFEHEGISAMQLYLNTFAKSPAWVNFLMGVRNRVVGLFGLKNLGGMRSLKVSKPASAYRVGDRAGIFSVRYLSENEVILGDDDKHLDVQVSVLKQLVDGQQFIVVTTVVHIHNNLGRAYMFFVGPAHKLIAPAVLAKA